MAVSAARAQCIATLCLRARRRYWRRARLTRPRPLTRTGAAPSGAQRRWTKRWRRSAAGASTQLGSRGRYKAWMRGRDPSRCSGGWPTLHPPLPAVLQCCVCTCCAVAAPPSCLKGLAPTALPSPLATQLPAGSYYKLEPEEEELLREVVGRDDTEMERDNPFDVLAPAPPASSAVSGVAHERLPGALGSGASAPTGGAAGSGGNDSVAWAAGGRGGAGPESWGGGGQLDVAGLRARLAEINAQLEAFGSMRDAHGGSCSEGGEGGGGSRRASMLSAAASLADSGASMLAQLCAPAPSERGSSMGGRAGGSGCGARRASGAGSSKDGCASDAPLGVSRRASCGVSRAGSSGGPKRGGLQGAPASSSRRGNDGGSLQGSSQHGGSQHEGGQPGGSMQGAAARGGADYLRELREVKEREARCALCEGMVGRDRCTCEAPPSS